MNHPPQSLSDLKLDCFHYLGEKPCRYGNQCPGCDHYQPIGKRILIIKLGALGDALRSLAILPGLRKAYPDSEIVWATDGASYPLLQMADGIDRLCEIDATSLAVLTSEEFDLVISLDKDPLALALAEKVTARRKMGFGKTKEGRLTILNQASEYSLILGVNDHLKFFENPYTYQELIYQMAELPYRGEKYTLEPAEDDREWARSRAREWGINEGDFVVGFNTGAGSRFATKRWTVQGFVDLARTLLEKREATVILLGGEAEQERNRQIADTLGDQVIHPGGGQSLGRFLGLIDLCEVVVTADTLAMHMAIARDVYTVVLFGPTVAGEIDLYGRGAKIIGVEDCAPCYLQHCKWEVSCVEKIRAETVFEFIEEYYREEVFPGGH